MNNTNVNRILFAKEIYNSYELAYNALFNKHLAPGELAGVRYYSNVDDNLKIRLLLGCGTIKNGHADIFVFTDNGDNIYSIKDKDGNIFNFNTVEDAVLYIFKNWQSGVITDLSEYYTKTEIDALLKNDDLWKELVNTKFEYIDDRLVNISNDIDEIRKKVDDASINVVLSNYYTKSEIDELLKSVEVDLSNYYNKSEIDELFNSIDLSKYYTKSEIDELLKSVEVDLSNYYNKSEIDEQITRIDTSIIEISDNIETTVENIISDSSAVANAVNLAIEKADIDKKVEDALVDADIVTTSEFENVVSESEYINNNIIIPLNKLIENQNDFDVIGDEEWPWYMATATSELELQNAINDNTGVDIESDILLNETLIINADKVVAINVNDNTLSKSGTGATIRVNGGSLMIDGNSGIIDGNNNGQELGDNSAIRCSEGGHIIINGGHFTCGDDGKNLGNSCIYCTEGLIEIYGGTFAQTSSAGRIYTLNCQDKNYKDGKAKIIVYGGTFLNGYDPADSKSENPAGNFVADGYESIYDIDTNSYTVKKINK